MAHAMVDYLRSDMECEGLLECLHGLKALDRRCYTVLVSAGEPMTVDELVTAVDRERSTVYRSVQRLASAGLVAKSQVNYEQGGYYHVYRPVSAGEIATDMQRLLDEWYEKMGELIEAFEEKYEDPSTLTAEH